MTRWTWRVPRPVCPSTLATLPGCAVSTCRPEHPKTLSREPHARSALPSSTATVPVGPQVPGEDVDRKPVGGTKMEKDILARTVERLRDSVIHKQVVSGREFKGCPFNSKPKLIHFKVSPWGSRVTEGDTAPVISPSAGGDHAPPLGGSHTSPRRPREEGMWLQSGLW